MGLGDLQLITILGGWVGAGNILVSIFLASILGIVTWAILNKIYGYEINRHIPFAPQLCLSAIVIYMMKSQNI